MVERTGLENQHGRKVIGGSNPSISAMVPLAKKNIHESEYHLQKMRRSQNVEELEINFAAFVNSSRNITFVLKKEFTQNSTFNKWYQNKENEMKNDELCIFFKNLRNEIIKEGINRIICSTLISSLNSKTDMVNRPPNSGLQMSGKGIYYLVNKGTSKEDLIPAKTKGQIVTKVAIQSAPKKHLNKIISNNNIIQISEIYLNYLRIIVEEWTGIINKSK